MILHEFPRLDWLKAQITDNFQNGLGWRNQKLKTTGFPSTLLNVKAHNCERKDVTGIFSVFMNRKGTSQVKVNQKTLPIGEDFFVLSFPEDNYSLFIDSPTETETCNFHLSAQNFQQILASVSLPADYLLDNVDFQLVQDFHLPFQTIPKDLFLYQKIAQITQQPDIHAFDELINEVCTHILQASSAYRLAPQALPAQRKATQAELLKRLSVAREFIHAHFHEAIEIDDICAVCCLSKFHFIRVFKEVFQTTPHQYIQALRINKASYLLKSTPLTLQDVAFAVGYENASTLSKVYKALKGHAPRN